MKDLETLVSEHLSRDADAVRFETARWTDEVAVRRRRPRGIPSLRTLGTVAAALVLLAGVVVPLALVSGLVGDGRAVPGGRSLDGYGLRIQLPEGWDGLVRGPAGTMFGPHLHAANFELPEQDDDVASSARAGMTEDQVTIVVIDVTTALARDVRGPQEPYEPAELPVRIRPEDFTDRVEAVDPDHASARRQVSVGDRSLELRVEFGTDPPPERLVAEANDVLTSLSIEPLGETSGYRRHVDVDDGLAITIPDAWTFRQDPTRPIEPKNVFGVGSWAFPRGGECAPTAAQEDLLPDGTLFWLIEYPGDQQEADFPPRPEHFALQRETLGVYECSTAPSYMIRFRDHGRFFQFHVAFGPDASESLEPEVLRALESLEVGGICDVADDAYVPSVLPTSGPVGSRATVTGEVNHGEPGPGGPGFPVDPTMWIEVWWNLDPGDTRWPSAIPGGEDPIPAEPGPVVKLGRVDVAASCTYGLAFTVPEAPAGTYPIVVLYGSDESGSAFEPIRFDVTG
jgi:hypothetical protein